MLLNENRSPNDEVSFQTPVARHHYSAGVVQLFLKIVLSCAASQRATAAVLDLIGQWLPGVHQTPCANTGRMWLLRLGLYELTREKEQADDWVWIMDHTIQLGPWKCLVIVGVRLSVWTKNRGPLQHDDLQLLNLTPMEQATGERVYEAMVETMARTGIPRQITSDGGTELKKGVEFLHANHPDVAHVYDVTHKMALLLKKELEHSERWTSFVTLSNKAKLGMTQTALAYLVPPALKTKARYMNLDTLVHWGGNILQYLDHPPTNSQTPVDLVKLTQKCGWVQDYRGDLREWSELLALAGTTEEYVRHEGYHREARRRLSKELAPLATTPSAERMRAAILDFVTQESAAVKTRQERLVGNSEVLESLIGKYKHMQSTHGKGGMTAMLLSFGAIVSTKTHETIQAALNCIRTTDVLSWCRTTLGNTLQSQRKLAFEQNKNGIQTIHADG